MSFVRHFIAGSILASVLLLCSGCQCLLTCLELPPPEAPTPVVPEPSASPTAMPDPSPSPTPTALPTGPSVPHDLSAGPFLFPGGVAYAFDLVFRASGMGLAPVGRGDAGWPYDHWVLVSLSHLEPDWRRDVGVVGIWGALNTRSPGWGGQTIWCDDLPCRARWFETPTGGERRGEVGFGFDFTASRKLNKAIFETCDPDCAGDEFWQVKRDLPGRRPVDLADGDFLVEVRAQSVCVEHSGHRNCGALPADKQGALEFDRAILGTPWDGGQKRPHKFFGTAGAQAWGGGAIVIAYEAISPGRAPNQPPDS